jgi:organic radical activating enzyme
MTFCPLPWTHLATHPHGPITLCCEADHKNRNSESFDNKGEERIFHTLNSTDYNFYKLYNSDNFKEVRKQMLQGKKPAPCSNCYLLEENNLESKRLRESKRLNFTEHDARKITSADGTIKNINFEFIELRLGNHCNLACRTCNPMSSTKWIRDYEKLYGRKFEIDRQDFNWPLDENFWKQLKKTSNALRFLYINGGEPLLIDKHLHYLEFLVDNDLAKNICLQYSTNATVIDERYVELWKQFKHVNIMLSIDDLGERNSYIRFPADWQKVEQTIEWFDNLARVNSNINCVICQTVSILNIFYLKEFHEYFANKGISITHNFVTDPEYYDVVNLPIKVKNHLNERLKNLGVFDIINYIYSKKEDLDKFKYFMYYTSQLDKIRKQSFKESFPEWEKLLREYNG